MKSFVPYIQKLHSPCLSVHCRTFSTLYFPRLAEKKVPVASRSFNPFPFRPAHKISRSFKMWHSYVVQMYEPKPFFTSGEMQNEQPRSLNFSRFFFLSVRTVPHPHLLPLSTFLSFKRQKCFQTSTIFLIYTKKYFLD